MSFAQEKLKYKINHIILWGFSLGTGPTIEIASRYQNLGGVILQSPLASLMIWMDKNAKWDYNYSLSDVYCSINKIENVKAKLFIIHGKRDKTIDVRHSHLLYDKYINSGSDNNQIWLVIAEGAGHNDIQFLIEDCGGPFYKRIQKFLDMIKNPMKTFESKIGCKSYEKFMKREENKQFFYEKEVTSLKISFNNLLVNSYELEDNSKKIETSLTESRSSIKTALNSSQSSLLNKLNKDSDDNNLLELLKRNDCYISKEIPHSINISFCDDITFKKTNSVMYSSSNINIQENEQFRTTIKDFQNVNDFLIKNYFAKN